MASVMTIESEVFGSCVWEINVSVEEGNWDAWLCYGMKYLKFILAGKAAQYLRWRWEMMPGIGWHFGVFEGD